VTLPPISAPRRVLSQMIAVTALAPGRGWFARATPSHHVRLFSLESGQAVARPHGGAGVTEVAIAREQVAFARDGEPSLGLWNWRAGDAVRRLEGHTGEPSLARFAPDGKTLVSASTQASDRSLSVWDVGTGKEARRIPGWHPGAAAPISGFGRRTAPVLARP